MGLPSAVQGGNRVNAPRRRAYRGFHYYFRHWRGGALGGRWSPRGLQTVCNVCSIYESPDLHSGPSIDNTPILRLPPECHRNFFLLQMPCFCARMRPKFVVLVSDFRSLFVRLAMARPPPGRGVALGKTFVYYICVCHIWTSSFTTPEANLY